MSSKKLMRRCSTRTATRLLAAVACALFLPRCAHGDARSRMLVRRGLRRMDARRYDAALGFFIEALEVDPHDAEALYYQGRAAQALDDETRATVRKERREIARSIRKRVEKVRLASRLCEQGQAALKGGRTLEAEQIFRRARSAFPGHPCVSTGGIMMRQAVERPGALQLEER